MSALNFYLEKGFTPINKNVIFSGSDTVTVWSPVTNNRVIITNVSVASNISATVAFFFDDRQNPNARIAIFSTDGSTMVSPDIGCWESTVVSGKIYARKNTTLGEAIVNLTGFEIGAEPSR